MSYFLKMFVNRERSLYVTEFGHSTHKEPKTVGPWSREMYILHVVTKGYCDFSGFRVEAGQAFLIARERLHAFTVSRDYEHYWIGFMGDSVEKLFACFKLVHNTHQLFFVENIEFAIEVFSRTLEKLQKDSKESGELLALSTLTSILPLLKKEKQTKATVRTNYAEKVKFFIEANYTYPIKMTDIADTIHLSEKHMYRIFVEKYAVSPQKYLQDTRMMAAKNLLTQNDLSVKTVAGAVGYHSVPSFCKAFSKYYGSNPSSFRKKI